MRTARCTKPDEPAAMLSAQCARTLPPPLEARSLRAACPPVNGPVALTFQSRGCTSRHVLQQRCSGGFAWRGRNTSSSACSLQWQVRRHFSGGPMLYSRSVSGAATPEPPRRAVRMAVLAACVACVAGCGGSDGQVGDVYCPGTYCVPCTTNCGPSEVSYGLVAGNFAGNGFTSVVQTSMVVNGSGPYPGSLKASLGSGVGSFAAPVLTADGYSPLYLASADLNGDHLPDLVSASYDDGSLAVFFNNASSPGSFSAPLVLPSPGASQVAIADMNGDGLPDLISADFNVSLFLQSAPGAFAAPIPLYPGGANWVAAGDLNNDGVADVAVVDNYGVWMLLHTGAPTATTYAAPLAVYTEAPNAWYVGANIVAIADVNGDGLKDLIVTDPGPVGGGMPTVAVLMQNPASPGTFLAPVSYATASGSLGQSIAVVDVNGDGH